jgi:Kelch motif
MRQGRSPRRPARVPSRRSAGSPAPSSDQPAAAIGNTVYVVGGYTGSQWLDTIVAWRPGTQPRIVAHLPFALRYAAVTAADCAAPVGWNGEVFARFRSEAIELIRRRWLFPHARDPR